jgi:hypothetical protein
MATMPHFLLRVVFRVWSLFDLVLRPCTVIFAPRAMGD